MTKQEIKDLVAAKIAGQGSQVDIGGVLADILSGIVDAIPEGGDGNEPLMVKGVITADNTYQRFVPSSGQPTFDEVKDAIIKGKRVCFAIYDSNSDLINVTQAIVVSCGVDWTPYIGCWFLQDDHDMQQAFWDYQKL